jgi:hypothetical protein
MPHLHGGLQAGLTDIQNADMPPYIARGVYAFVVALQKSGAGVEMSVLQPTIGHNDSARFEEGLRQIRYD